MSDSLGFVFAIIFNVAVPPAITLYAAYWALSIRRALVGRIYRNHALWLGTLCILLTVGHAGNTSTNSIINLAGGISFIILFPVLFAFIDTTVRVARRSDPLLRTILRWEKLRIVIWADLVGLEAVIIATIANQAFGSSDLGNLLWTILIFFPFIAGGSALLIGARRSGDAVLRRSVKWLGAALLLAIVNMLVTSIVSNIPSVSQFDFDYSYPALPGAAATIVSYYALYRSARSLASLNRITSLEPVTVSPSDTPMN
jgi:hypothetical protein